MVTSQAAWGFHWKIQEAQFERGLKAYDKKDYATALKEWRPLAEDGMKDAQFRLGVMYAEGRGVPKNIILADMWWILAGGKNGTRNRNMIEMEMTPRQIENANRLAKEWMAKHREN